MLHDTAELMKSIIKRFFILSLILLRQVLAEEETSDGRIAAVVETEALKTSDATRSIC